MYEAAAHNPELSTSRILTSGISRSLRTPLHTLMGFLELLGMTELDDDQLRMVEHMTDDAESLIRASDRLLLLLRLTGRDQARRPQDSFELDRLIGEACPPTTAELQIRVDPQLPGRFRGDRADLLQILRELVDNAVTHSYGPVTVSVTPDGEPAGDRVPIRITVRDEGAGLSAGLLAALSEPPDVMAEKLPGLGLYIVRHLLTPMGGRLIAANAQLKGAVFSILLSLEPVFPPEPAAPTARPAPADRPLSVLLVEDNAVNLILAQRQMKLLGHDTYSVALGEDAVAAALTGRYDVVLMDRHLPDIDGIEATRRIRQGEQSAGTHRTPIIAVTADAMPGHREQCISAGMDGFLTKPLELNDLRATLNTFIAHDEEAAVDGEGGVVDTSVLRELAKTLGDENGDVIRELVNSYLSEIPGYHLQLRNALRRSSVAETERHAEALYGSSQAVGATRLTGLCEKIIVAVRNGDMRAAHELLGDLDDAYLATSSALAVFADQPSAAMERR